MVTGVDNIMALRIRRNPLLDKHGTACDCSFLVTARDGVEMSATSAKPINAHLWEAPVLLAPGSRADVTVMCKCENAHEKGPIVEVSKEKGREGSVLSVFELYSSVGEGAVASEVVAYVGANTPIMMSLIMQIGVRARVVLDSGYVFWSTEGKAAGRTSAAQDLREVLHRREKKMETKSKGRVYAQRAAAHITAGGSRDGDGDGGVWVGEEVEVETMHGCMGHSASGMYMQHAFNGQLFNASSIMAQV
jgi:hypothetical protein